MYEVEVHSANEFLFSSSYICSKRKTPEDPYGSGPKNDPYYSGYTGGQYPTSDMRNYTKREMPWPVPPLEYDPTYADENEYSYIAELPPPPSAGPTTGPGNINYPDPPKYFEFDPHVDRSRLPSSSGERYVGVGDNRVTLHGAVNGGIPVRKEMDAKLHRQVSCGGSSHPQSDRYFEQGHNNLSI